MNILIIGVSQSVHGHTHTQRHVLVCAAGAKTISSAHFLQCYMYVRLGISLQIGRSSVNMFADPDIPLCRVPALYDLQRHLGVRPGLRVPDLSAVGELRTW